MSKDEIKALIAEYRETPELQGTLTMESTFITIIQQLMEEAEPRPRRKVTMKLSEIRCETCPLWERTTTIPDRGHCLNLPPYATANDHACSFHPLWQQALEEEEKISATVEKGGSDEAR